MVDIKELVMIQGDVITVIKLSQKNLNTVQNVGVNYYQSLNN